MNGHIVTLAQPSHQHRAGSGSGEDTEPQAKEELATDLLILTDGTLLVHNLTPEMADVLRQLHELPE